MGAGLLEGVAEVDDACAVRLGGGRLHEGRSLGHDDGGGDARRARGEGHSLGVIPGAGGNDPASALLLREGVDGIECAANLERSGALQLLALEQDGDTRDPLKRARGPHGRLEDAVRDRRAGRLDVVDGDVGMPVHRLLQIVRRSQQWSQTTAISAGACEPTEG